MVNEKRAKGERRPKPSEFFARHFGEDRGVELPPPVQKAIAVTGTYPTPPVRDSAIKA